MPDPTPAQQADLFGTVAEAGPPTRPARMALADGVVLLPGNGFGALNPSVRVSLANLNEPDYIRIGATLQRLLEEYHQRWQDEGGN